MMRRELGLALALPMTLSMLFACPDGGGDDGEDGGASAADAATTDAAEGEAGTDAGCEPCGDVTVAGQCNGTLLRFCDYGCLVERDCSSEPGGPYSCGEFRSFYECLAGQGQACEPAYFECDPATNCSGNYPCDPAADPALVCVSEICALAGADAAMPDAAEPDAAPEADAATVTDAATVADAGALDTATVTDAAAPDSAQPDTSVPEDAAADAGVVEDAASAEDSAADEDAAGEDA